MPARRPCPPAPGPLEAYAAQFDPLFTRVSQRHSFRTYLTGLLLPRDRPKTRTALAGAEPLVQAQAAPVQQLQFLLSEAAWEVQALSARYLQWLMANPATAPSADGVLVIDDTGDRKKGSATDHVARQYLGAVGKIDNGIVAVTTLWANEQRDYPLQVMPYTPGERLALGKDDPAFHTKPQLALGLIESAQAAGIAFEAVVADAFYGDHTRLARTLTQRDIPYVLAHSGKASRGRASPPLAHSFQDAAQELPARAWQRVVRRFRDGHVERWRAAQLTLFGYGLDKPVRAVCVTTDWRTLPDQATWYLTTNLSPERAPIEEIVRLYGLRNWVEQSYRQMKQELGWADFMVRSDRAIRRHWALVCCAFACCWWHEADRARLSASSRQLAAPLAAPPRWRKKNRSAGEPAAAVLAAGAADGAGVVESGALAHALLERLFQQAPAARSRGLAPGAREGTGH
jgi:SRSO17 transposase